MDDSFDPYRIWLGIPLDEQPPNHYRLLGIARTETNPDVIDNAANRQMSYLRTFQSGPYVGLAQRILNEVSAAKICLLNADRRTAYDAQLGETSAASSNPEMPGPHGERADELPAHPAENAAVAAPPLPRVVSGRRPRARSRSPWPLILTMMLVVVALGALIVFFNRWNQ